MVSAIDISQQPAVRPRRAWMTAPLCLAPPCVDPGSKLRGLTRCVCAAKGIMGGLPQ